MNAIASRKKCSLLEVLWPQSDEGNLNIDQPPSVNICALVDSEGTPVEVADVVLAIAEEGFSSVKLKVRIDVLRHTLEAVNTGWEKILLKENRCLITIFVFCYFLN